MKEYFLEPHTYYRTNSHREDRQTILFVHGLSGSSSAWKLYEEKFEEKYNIISYDLRGHGKSKRFNSYKDYEIKYFTEDLYNLVTHLSLKKFFIVSHSFGTLFAVDFVLKYQELITGAIFLSPNFTVDKKWLSLLMSPITTSLQVLSPNASHKPGNHVDYSKFVNTGDWNIPRMIQDVSNTGLHAYFYCTRQVLGYNRDKYLKDLKIPVLIMHGRKDTIFPVKNSIRLLERIKNLELIIVEKTDHILVLNNFEEVSTSIETFVDRVSTI